MGIVRQVRIHVRTIGALAVVVATLAIASGPAWAQQSRPGDSLVELTRLAPDSYVLRSYGYTSLFVVTEEGVVVVDPIGQSNRQNTALLHDAIRSVTDQPVRYLVYSHWAADHGSGGNAFAETAQFVATQEAATRHAASADTSSPVANIVFADHMSIELGGATFDLYAAGISPRDHYLVFHYPAGRVVMAVDFVRVRELPFRDLQSAHPNWVLQALQWIDEALDFDHVVWGHGNATTAIGTRDDVRQNRQYMLDLTASIRAARDAGLADNSEEMVARVRADLAPTYGTWNNFGPTLPLNIQGVIRWWSQP